MRRESARISAIAFLLSIIASSVIAGDQSYTFAPSGRFVLTGVAAQEVFHQCSRPSPSPGKEIWTPSAAEIDELEHSLTTYLQSREKTVKDSPPIKVSYHRQYVGCTRNGERYIYGNFYPGDKEFSSRESKTAVMVCDGGPVFWGIVYRIKTKTFEDPRFNGVA